MPKLVTWQVDQIFHLCYSHWRIFNDVVKTKQHFTRECIVSLILCLWKIHFYSPHKAAHRISLLNLFLYFLISGVSEDRSCDVGVTFTLTWDSLLDWAEPAPKPKVRKERCFCCKASAFTLMGVEILLGEGVCIGDIAWRYWKSKT